ncbi:MAG: DMT family transporter [Pseudomonadota bacterium]
MPRTTANLLLLLAGLAWGGGFIAQSTAMDSIGPFLFLGLRFCLASFALIPFVIWEARRSDAKPLSPVHMRSLVVAGIVFFAAMALQQVGILATTVTNAGMLTGLYVVLVPIIAWALLGQRQPWIIWPSAATALVGIWFIGGGGLDRLTWGDWVMVGAAVLAAFHVLAVGHAAQTSGRPMALAAAQFLTCGFAGLIGFGLCQGFGVQFEPQPSLKLIAAAAPEIFYAGLIAGALAFTLMAFCQQFTNSADAGILLSSEALFAALGGALILGERLDILGYVGCAMLFAAILLVSMAGADEVRPEAEIKKNAHTP